MDLNKFTEESQAALMEAQNIATRNQHQAVDVEHLVLAAFDEPAAAGIGKIFKTLDVRRYERIHGETRRCPAHRRAARIRRLRRTRPTQPKPSAAGPALWCS